MSIIETYYYYFFNMNVNERSTNFATFLETHDICFKTVEMHTGGEPVRIVVSGYPLLEGDTILEKRNYAKDAKDHFRKMLMFEPRGHHDMYGVLLVKPDNQRADIGVLFIHNEGYSTMCGHAVISLGRFAVDYNYVKLTEPETQVNIQCPCGLVKTTVECKDGKTGAVRFESVVAFVSHTGRSMTLMECHKVLSV